MQGVKASHAVDKYFGTCSMGKEQDSANEALEDIHVWSDVILC